MERAEHLITDMANFSMMYAEDTSALRNVMYMTDRMGETDEKNMLMRMIYSSAVSILETYLDEVLNCLVFSDRLVFQRLAASPKFIKFNSDEKRVRERLSRQIFHRLDDVEAFYKAATGVDIFPNEDLKERLKERIKVRHGLVHKNGRSSAYCSLDSTQALLNDIDDLIGYMHERVKAGVAQLHKGG